MSDAPVIVARIARPHGIRGGLLLEAETDHAETLFRAGRRLDLIDATTDVRADAGARADAGTPAGGSPRPRALTLETARPHGRRWLVEVCEVADRTAAEKLRGARLGVPREELPDLPDGGYLLHDLIGMSVCEADMTIGVIREVYDQPGAPLLALEVGGRERLIPFEAELVVELDFEAGEVHMKLPAGLLDI
ncbi:ribosome maturation factor RimM [Candidatus Palauibacter polyketidifaciens]|uniref:ribosome maturation factor RimM n=1 Tax=Candidatus Palauibacter polyketidifaciens TaxID=3056740 RepID=UPI00139F0162|nr:ribosome maturation factor RimM [Candidatus Palauibacter polyketidifaciens]MDE2719774.1 ribosome maturation factor RimM [Candidatus Palauibacter polyketidifaciens]MYE35917.1 16S rRNA processing protein RimM [Gemmatimonadales bacterium]